MNKPLVPVYGEFKKTFAEANLAIVSELPSNEGYEHYFFAMMGVRFGRVTLASKGKAGTFPIRTDYSGREYIEFAQRGVWEREAGLPPTVFRVIPFST